MRTLGLFFTYLVLPCLADNIVFETEDPCKDHLPHFCQCLEDTIECTCNGQDLHLTSRGTGRVGTMLVRNCGVVEISPRSFENTGVKFTAVNVDQLVLHKHAFLVNSQEAAEISCSVINTTVHLIPAGTFAQRSSRAFPGNPGPKFSLKIIKSRVGLIERNAMENLSVDHLELCESSFNDTRLHALNINLTGNMTIMDSRFMYIQRNAFTFQGQNPKSVFRLHGNDFQGPVSKAFVGSFRGQANISDNTFPHLKSSPFVLWAEGFVDIRNNTFDVLTDLGLNVTGKSRITLAYNTIKHLKPYAFRSLYAKDYEATLFFDSNHIYHYDTASLNIHTGIQSDAVVIKGNVFEGCSCNITQDITKGIGLRNRTYQDLLSDKVYSQWFHQNHCLKKGVETVRIDKYATKYCAHSNTTIILVVFAVILIIIAVGVILAWRRIRHGSTTAQRSLNSSSASGPYSSVAIAAYTHPTND